MEKNTQIIAIMLKRLLGQLKGSENLKRVLRAIGSEIQVAEDLFWDLFTSIDLETATGATLNLWGALLSESRNGRTDAQFRAFLKVKVLRNTSQGTPERLIAILRQLTSPTTITIREGSAWIELAFVDGTIEASVRPILLAIIKAAAPAGVEVIQVVEEPANAFRFDTPGSGFDDGEFSQVI